jgi:hypothetical protein
MNCLGSGLSDNLADGMNNKGVHVIAVFQVVSWGALALVWRSFLGRQKTMHRT